MKSIKISNTNVREWQDDERAKVKKTVNELWPKKEKRKVHKLWPESGKKYDEYKGIYNKRAEIYRHI